jgi:hypothetical protein
MANVFMALLSLRRFGTPSLPAQGEQRRSFSSTGTIPMLRPFGHLSRAVPPCRSHLAIASRLDCGPSDHLPCRMKINARGLCSWRGLRYCNSGGTLLGCSRRVVVEPELKITGSERLDLSCGSRPPAGLAPPWSTQYRHNPLPS